MSFFTRLSNGWVIAKTSLKVLNAHKELIIFPILSGIAMLLIIGSFFTVLLAGADWNIDNFQIGNIDRGGQYLIIFGFYVVNYFVVVFFNMALMHCAKLYFDGEEVSVSKGLQFSLSRIGAILSWAVFAATVGMLLRMIQDKAGWIGKIIIGLVGFVWSAATFFVIPVIAYEKLGPMDSVKRSAQLMKEKWGESIGANFSIGMIAFFAILVFGVFGAAVTALVNEALGIGIFVIGFLAIITVTSALHSIFISAVMNIRNFFKKGKISLGKPDFTGTRLSFSRKYLFAGQAV